MTTGAGLVKGASRPPVARQAGAVTKSSDDRNLPPAADHDEDAEDGGGNALDGADFTTEMDDGAREVDDRSGATDGTPENAG